MCAQNIKIDPCETQVEAAAKAWLEWQFKGRRWEDAVPSLRESFLKGSRVILAAAASAVCNE